MLDSDGPAPPAERGRNRRARARPAPARRRGAGACGGADAARRAGTYHTRMSGRTCCRGSSTPLRPASAAARSRPAFSTASRPTSPTGATPRTARAPPGAAQGCATARVRGCEGGADGGARGSGGSGATAAEVSSRLCRVLAERLAAALQRAPGGNDGEAVDLAHVVATLCAAPPGLRALARAGALPAVAVALPQLVQSLHQPARLSGLAALEAVADAAAAAGAEGGAGAGEAELQAVGAELERALAPAAALLFKLSRSAVQEDKVGALCCMRALARHAWGVRSLFAIADFLPTLTDRKSPLPPAQGPPAPLPAARAPRRQRAGAPGGRAESGKRALDEKLRVVEAALAHPEAEALLGPDRLALLRHFAAAGALRAQPHAQPHAPLHAPRATASDRCRAALPAQGPTTRPARAACRCPLSPRSASSPRGARLHVQPVTRAVTRACITAYR